MALETGQKRLHSRFRFACGTVSIYMAAERFFMGGESDLTIVSYMSVFVRRQGRGTMTTFFEILRRW
jgi:hypothetical protein